MGGRSILWRIRCLVASLSVLAFFSVLVYIIIYATNNKFLSSPSSFATMPYNDLSKAAIDNKLEQVKAFYQIGLVLLGAIWALIIAKKDEARILLSWRHWPEAVMFISASLLLLFSAWAYISYLRNISLAYTVGAVFYNKDANNTMPNIFDPQINYWSVAQFWFLITGAVTAVATLVSAHQLRGDEDETDFI